jgi:ATPase subunit of ABC transporter with duplicated ATPase domains
MISFSNIKKQYGKQLLFVDASFQLNPGEKVGLVGPNGAGKTTLFRMVVGEETPDKGAVSESRGQTGTFTDFHSSKHLETFRLSLVSFRNAWIRGKRKVPTEEG